LFLDILEVETMKRVFLVCIRVIGLHPSYQDIWLSRLGYDADSYRATIAETLAGVGAPAGSGPEQ